MFVDAIKGTLFLPDCTGGEGGVFDLSLFGARFLLSGSFARFSACSISDCDRVGPVSLFWGAKKKYAADAPTRVSRLSVVMRIVLFIFITLMF